MESIFLRLHVANLLGFKKAFDKVPHQRLLLKLKTHGMGNSIINWIEQWLTERRQRVVLLLLLILCRAASSAAYSHTGDLEWEGSPRVTHSSADWCDLLLPLA